ncbi:MAG: 16S rRNA (uracil(1498)-N(3))-methyltransferase [Desulfuromonadales bacterium]|nr:MAG: 16S rRNA (uracil(1498)-N(3))-methyltransferase [Desulfuromonadales bacterium]
MTARRFIATGLDLSGTTVEVRGDLFRHMATVLRLKIDTRVILTDGCGTECGGIIRELGRDHLVVDIMERSTPAMQGKNLRITLYQGLPKGEKMELILQKATELGVSAVVPFPAERSITRIPSDRQEERLRRWRRIVEEAARQSGRADVPNVRLAGGMVELGREAGHQMKLLLWEAEQATSLRETLAAQPQLTDIAVIVGPEGGITSGEAEIARKGGFIPVTLGRRILRTETAGIALVAILQYLYGDLGERGEPS